jgi:hypothetical protein
VGLGARGFSSVVSFQSNGGPAFGEGHGKSTIRYREVANVSEM